MFANIVAVANLTVFADAITAAGFRADALAIDVANTGFTGSAAFTADRVGTTLAVGARSLTVAAGGIIVACTGSQCDDYNEEPLVFQARRMHGEPCRLYWESDVDIGNP